MFPDIAVAKPCVECHNKHKDSPKTDWELNDVMGATTWLYPKAQVDSDELIQMINTLREGFRVAYGNLVAEMRGRKPAPNIGAHWPAEGYYLPDVDTFMKKAGALTANETLLSLLAFSQTDPKASRNLEHE